MAVPPGGEGETVLGGIPQDLVMLRREQGVAFPPVQALCVVRDGLRPGTWRIPPYGGVSSGALTWLSRAHILTGF